VGCGNWVSSADLRVQGLSWLGIAELGCDRRKPLVEDPGPVMSGVGLGNLLPPVRHNQSN
jgi:hypothetical protein